MTLRDRESLMARIRHLRRSGAAAGQPGPARALTSESPQTVAGGGPGAPDGREREIDVLEARIVHLEQLVEGLQDAVHREARRQDKLIAELQAQVQPPAMSAALSRDARARGL